MCGKITQPRTWDELDEATRFMLGREAGDETVTPMRLARVIALGRDGRRKSVAMRWGLGTAPHIHARAESIDIRPAFREAFRRRRGLLVVTSFNEGKEITPARTEQYGLTPEDGLPMAIAVVWENGAAGLAFAMVTVAANALVSTITDRMPALIAEEDWPQWLGERPASIDELKAMLRPSERPLRMRKASRQHDDLQPMLL